MHHNSIFALPMCEFGVYFSPMSGWLPETKDHNPFIEFEQSVIYCSSMNTKEKVSTII